MPIIQFKSCTVEGDLAQALLDLEQQIGETSEALTQSIIQIESPQAELIAMENKLNEILQNSPVPSSPTTIAESVGIPLPFATSKDDEIRLEQHGLILINGVVWKKGTDSNVLNYRKLYFSLGENLTRFFQALNSPTGFVVVQRKLNVYKLPKKLSWTVQEARETLNNYSIEKIYKRNSDYYAVVLTYLADDISKAQAALQFELLEKDIITEVYWIGSVKNDSATLNKLKNLGITDSYLSSVIVGRPLSSLRFDLIEDSILRINQYRAQIVSQINFLSERLNIFDATSKNSMKGEILKSISLAQNECALLEQYVRFNSIVVPVKDNLNLFLAKNTQEDLEYLFKQRRTVLSIDFTASTLDIVERVRQILSIPLGSVTTSTLILNNSFSELDSLIDQANFENVKFLCGKNQVDTTDFSYVSFQVAIACLNSDYEAETEQAPVQGYPSYDSPATLLQRNANWMVTLNTDEVMNALEKLAGSVAEALRPLISAITAANRSANAAIDKFFNDLNNKVAGEIRNIESFMSRYMSFFGTVGVDSSLLKCALGFNLNADLPFLDDILPLIEALRRKVRNFVAQIMAVVSKAIAELVSLPVQLINAILENVEDFLPAFCKVNRVSLPKDVEKNLDELRLSSQVQSDSSLSFNQSLARLQASAEAMPTKFQNFKDSMTSRSEPSSRFLKEFKKQADISIPGNPVAAVGGLLGL